MMDDGRIVDLFFLRDEAAIEGCDAKYGGRLRGLSGRIIGDTQAAEEVTNDTYMKAWGSIPPKNPRDYLYAFLSKIARHLSLDRIRHMKREKRNSELTVISDELTECLPSSDSADAEIFQGELSELIGSFLKELKADERDIFVYRYFLFKSTSECAKHFEASEGKIKSSLFRTRLKLKLYLEERSYYV